ncbi:hypothetical protein [Spirosoma pollinicola]|uniref:Uncharacterized protein n=1 Tax=Spirosoma pollinicola TaxID=2057025 RepID=A0A2K8YXT5_9BACT|nr:hypothetical protein [Spirosoma pollinicola]AUD02432.1 hypothetical protein CWM47_11700 [Spirosoma pollinicola]
MTYGTLTNLVYAESKPADPKIGDGATLILWSDRQAFTVVDVKKSYVVVSRDNQPPALRKAYLRKNGNYYLGGHLLKIGFREEYYDPHF